ncbi:MAG: DNA polymerase III subunit gamma/tau [Desulfobulbus sp.]|nr:DNA polymerase III subunit gamma/tau [Desulfobulbus sp.]
MSYLVLARKSRPQTFADVVGQKPVVRTLQNGLTQNRVAHALIFSGIRGTGKTTLARIMAKALNCEQGPAEEPCNQCRSCREISEGTSIDLQEVDGASNRGIQEIRELKENIRFMPTSSRYKIIIIDEVHMLTTEAFNALLKTLEEPPDHVYFMFATTELHKVPVTILSRCQRYELKRLTHRELADHFLRLAGEEGVQMESEAVDMIVRESGGSVRDGLSLLDQVFSYCGTEVKASEVGEVLGLVSHQLVGHLGTALLQGELATIYQLLEQMYLHGTDIKRFSNDLLQWFRSLVVCKISPDPHSMLELQDEELTHLQATASAYSLETISAMFNLLLEGLEKTAFSQQPRLSLELTFIRAVQFKDVVPVSTLISRFDQLLAGLPLEQLPAAAAPPVNRPIEQLQPAPVAPLSRPIISGAEETPPHPAMQPLAALEPVPALQKKISEKKKREEPTPSPKIPQPESIEPDPQLTAPQGNPPVVVPPDAAVLPAETSVVSPNEGKKRIRQHWDGFLQYVRERQPWIAAALQMASSIERKDDQLLIHFADSADCTMLRQRNNIKGLSEYLLDYFQENLTLQFEVPGSNACSVDPANGLAAQHERRALANEPMVLTALDIFTGQVGDIRIGPRYRTRSEETPPADEEAVNSDD